jgi:hypothetical protein
MRYIQFLVLLLIGIAISIPDIFANSLGDNLNAEVEPDQNFHIYICFGQSNMEGASSIKDNDREGVDSRFQVMTVSAEDFQHLGREKGEWHTANPPLCRWNNGLTPADYFGRTLVDSLPDSIKLGVIMVAMGGSGIDAFDKENYTQYYQNADAWQKGLMDIYGGNPYAKIIEMAKIGQQSGVVKGILLHQGETNNGQTDWPLKVQKIYYDILDDLDIEPNSTPLLAGEMLRQEQGGICWGMNSIIANLPNYIPNSHVISSEGCSGIDDFHFSNEGQKELGKRYGIQMLSLLETYDSDEGKTVDHLEMDNLNITMLSGARLKIPLTAVFADGYVKDVCYLAEYNISDNEVVVINNGILETQKDGNATITASYKGALGEEKQITFKVSSSTFPLTNEMFNPRIWENGTFDETTKTLKTGPWGFGGWQYDGIDLSGYKYIVARIGSENNADIDFRVFDGASYWGSPAISKFGNKKEVVVRLKDAKKDDGSPLNPENIYIAGFWSNGNNPFVIDTVFLSNSKEYDIPIILVKNGSGNEISKLENFNYTAGTGPSVSQSFVVSGDMLNDNLVIEVPEGFEISMSETGVYNTSLLIEPEEGVVASSEIYIRLASNLEPGSYAEALLISSGGAQTISVSLNGNVGQKVGIVSIHAGKGEVLSTSYYTLTGQKIEDISLLQGVFIKTTIMADGEIKIKKFLKQ